MSNLTNNVIKWSGSKRCHAKQIISHFPDDICGDYIEPFCGGCSVLLELISNPEWYIKRKNITRYICSDINRELIEVWKMIKEHPDYLSNQYELMWEEFNQPQENTTIEQHRKDYFLKVRNIFNNKKYDTKENTSKTVLFYFITRTCFSGLIRYNSKGELNTTCHFTRPGMHPVEVNILINNTSKLLNEFDVQFFHESYLETLINYDTFLFLDPPYSGSDNKKMYYGNINEQELISFLNDIWCRYILTYNGDRGENKGKRLKLNNNDMILLDGKNSSYSRLNGINVNVKEIMYIKK